MAARRPSTSHVIASGSRRAARRMALQLLSGLTLASVMPAITLAQSLDGARPAPRDLYADHIADASQRFGVPVAWIRAVMRAESAGNARAISRKGAMGLMQIMPATWTALSARYVLGADPFDPRANILAGAAYLREMLDRYGDLASALAAYNAGPGRVDDYRANGRPLPGETLSYVARILPDAGGEATRLSLSSAGANRSVWRSAALFIERDDARSNTSDAATSAPVSEVPMARNRAHGSTVSARFQRADRVSSSLFAQLSDGTGR